MLRLGADGEVEPVRLVQCSLRRGRSAEPRERFGAAIGAVPWLLLRERPEIQLTGRHVGSRLEEQRIWRARHLGQELTIPLPVRRRDRPYDRLTGDDESSSRDRTMSVSVDGFIADRDVRLAGDLRALQARARGESD